MELSDIRHDAARRRYSVVIEGVEAYLTYETPREDVVHITHTIVPDALGGRGLGKKLVTRAVQDALRDGHRIASSCGFATALINKTPDWQQHLA